MTDLSLCLFNSCVGWLRRGMGGGWEVVRVRGVGGGEGLCGGGSGAGQRVWWIGRFSSWSDLLWKSLLGIASADFPREYNEMTDARYPPPPPQNGANFQEKKSKHQSNSC